MAQYISPEQRAKILSAIKDEGMGIPDVAKTFPAAEKTIKRWLRSLQVKTTNAAIFAPLKPLRSNYWIRLLRREGGMRTRPNASDFNTWGSFSVVNVIAQCYDIYDTTEQRCSP